MYKGNTSSAKHPLFFHETRGDKGGGSKWGGLI
jgi:hypothetical protein